MSLLKPRMPWLTHRLYSLVSLSSLFASVCSLGATTGDTQGYRNAHFCVIWLAATLALTFLGPQPRA